MNDVIIQKVRQVVADMLAIAVERVPLESPLSDCENWDSLNHLRIVLALEEEFEVHFGHDEVERMVTVEAMVSQLSARLPSTSAAVFRL